MIAYLTI